MSARSDKPSIALDVGWAEAFSLCNGLSLAPSAVRNLAARVDPGERRRGPDDGEDRQHESRLILLRLHGEPPDGS